MSCFLLLFVVHAVLECKKNVSAAFEEASAGLAVMITEYDNCDSRSSGLKI